MIWTSYFPEQENRCPASVDLKQVGAWKAVQETRATIRVAEHYQAHEPSFAGDGGFWLRSFFVQTH